MKKRQEERRATLTRLSSLQGFSDEGGTLRAGSPGKPAIVFLHPAACTRLAYISQMDALSDEFHCMSVDAAGHGTRAGPAWTMDESVSHVLSVLDAANVDSAIFVGISLGGYTAMELARVRPQLVRGLMLSGCSMDFTGTTPPFLKLESVAEDYETKMLKGRTDLGTDFDSQDFKDAIWDLSIRKPGTTPINMFHCFCDWDLHCARYQHGIQCTMAPVLVAVPQTEVHGALHTLKNAEELAARSPGDATVEVVPNVGHLWNVEDAELFNKATRDFARKCFAMPPPSLPSNAPAPCERREPGKAAPPVAPTPPGAWASDGQAPKAKLSVARPGPVPYWAFEQAAFDERVRELQEEFFAEDITPPDEAFATWTDAELAQFFEQGGVVHR
jgi:pimeloyl-ACP methyl ester carboxylesterase